MWARMDSNHRSTSYKGVALAAKLLARFSKIVPDSNVASTKFATDADCAVAISHLLSLAEFDGVVMDLRYVEVFDARTVGLPGELLRPDHSHPRVKMRGVLEPPQFPVDSLDEPMSLRFPVDFDLIAREVHAYAETRSVELDHALHGLCAAELLE